MDSCMAAMVVVESFCFGSLDFGMDIKLFDFAQGTSLEYESCRTAVACTTISISEQTIKITSGCGVAVHVWDDKCIVKELQTTKNSKWRNMCQMVSDIYEDEEVAECISNRRTRP